MTGAYTLTSVTGAYTLTSISLCNYLLDERDLTVERRRDPRRPDELARVGQLDVAVILKQDVRIEAGLCQMSVRRKRSQ